MPRLTKEERAELEARLADDDADDDESDEVTVSRPDGSSFTGTFRRALQLGLVSLPKTDDKADPKKRVSVLTPRTRNTGS
jgi:hypothetical protein